MSLVATLISHPAKRALTPDVATMAMKALDASAIDWLGENLACDIALKPGLETEAAETLLREALAGAPVDVAVQDLTPA